MSACAQRSCIGSRIARYDWYMTARSITGAKHDLHLAHTHSSRTRTYPVLCKGMRECMVMCTGVCMCMGVSACA